MDKDNSFSISSSTIALDDKRLIGSAVAERIAMHQQIRAQMTFLNTLSKLPLGQYVTLCGAAALHGVYLKQRFSRTLDLYGPSIVVMRFQDLLHSAGVTVKRYKNQSNRFIFTCPASTLPDSKVLVNVFTDTGRSTPPVRAFFAPLDDSANSNNLIRVMPLIDLLSEKWHVVLRAGRPKDFIDIWFGLRSNPDIFKQSSESKKLLLNNSSKDVLMMREKSVQIVLRQLDNCASVWTRDFISLKSRSAPDFDVVKSDLTAWLPAIVSAFE